ncbi:pyruvate dehydrogenase complex dihydrolipoamide acetyltransferase [soil metagenome]
MATKIFMEALSPTMEEGRLLTWMKAEGDEVKEGDVLAEVETDKATMEVAARGSGVLRKLIIGEGDTAAVGTLIGVIAGADEDISSLVDDAVEEGSGSGAKPSEAPDPSSAEDEEEADVAEAPVALAGSEHTEEDQAERATPAESAGGSVSGDRSAARGGEGRADGEGRRVKASPLARRLASEEGVSLDGVKGTGPGGRIVKRDIESAVEAGPKAGRAPTPEAPAAAAPEGVEYTEVSLSQMRKTIARRLTQSIGPVPHFFLTIEVDMRQTMSFRKKLNERLADEGVKVSPNDLIIKSVAMALKKHPWVNAAWTGDSIRLYDAVHIGVAVAVEDGLITPIIRNAHQKGVGQIAKEVKELAGRAREKKLKPEEYTGSTFSISNLGMFGITEFTAVINPPEAAILAVGGIEEKVVAEDGEMVIRPRMRVTLSCDHRVIDGATGAQFLQTLRSFLEEPMMMIS